jgi:hypothetical protein
VLRHEASNYPDAHDTMRRSSDPILTNQMPDDRRFPPIAQIRYRVPRVSCQDNSEGHVLSIFSAMIMTAAAAAPGDSCEYRFYADSLMRVFVGSKDAGLSYVINYHGDTVDLNGDRSYLTSSNQNTNPGYYVTQLRDGRIRYGGDAWPFQLCADEGLSWRVFPTRPDAPRRCMYLGLFSLDVLGEQRVCKRFLTYLGTEEEVVSPLHDIYVLEGVGVVAEIEAVHGMLGNEAVAVQYRNSWIGYPEIVSVSEQSRDRTVTQPLRVVCNDHIYQLQACLPIEITVFDLQGRVMEQLTSDADVMQLQERSPGVYLISYVSACGRGTIAVLAY